MRRQESTIAIKIAGNGYWKIPSSQLGLPTTSLNEIVFCGYVALVSRCSKRIFLLRAANRIKLALVKLPLCQYLQHPDMNFTDGVSSTRVIRWHLKNWWKYTTRRFGYVFCSRGQDLSDRSEYHAILKQLLRQASSNPFTGDVSQIVIDHYKKEGRDFGKPPPLLVRETEQLLIDVLNASDLVFRVMIDALDECDHPEKLLGILESVSNATTGTLELLVSSRPDVEVVDEFSNCIKIDLNTAASKSDMLTFITREVENKEKRKRLLKGKRPDLEKRLISILERRAGGM